MDFNLLTQAEVLNMCLDDNPNFGNFFLKIARSFQILWLLARSFCSCYSDTHQDVSENIGATCMKICSTFQPHIWPSVLGPYPTREVKWSLTEWVPFSYFNQIYHSNFQNHTRTQDSSGHLLSQSTHLQVPFTGRGSRM